jgi:hypothetical protein
MIWIGFDFWPDELSAYVFVGSLLGLGIGLSPDNGIRGLAAEL